MSTEKSFEKQEKPVASEPAALSFASVIKPGESLIAAGNQNTNHKELSSGALNTGDIWSEMGVKAPGQSSPELIAAAVRTVGGRSVNVETVIYFGEAGTDGRPNDSELREDYNHRNWNVDGYAGTTAYLSELGRTLNQAFKNGPQQTENLIVNFHGEGHGLINAYGETIDLKDANTRQRFAEALQGKIAPGGQLTMDGCWLLSQKEGTFITDNFPNSSVHNGNVDQGMISALQDLSRRLGGIKIIASPDYQDAKTPGMDGRVYEITSSGYKER